MMLSSLWLVQTKAMTCYREAAARERLAMLKSNDVQAYLKLVRSAKNSRLSQLLKQTDACLNKLAARLKLKGKFMGSSLAAATALDNTADNSKLGFVDIAQALG